MGAVRFTFRELILLLLKITLFGAWIPGLAGIGDAPITLFLVLAGALLVAIGMGDSNKAYLPASYPLGIWIIVSALLTATFALVSIIGSPEPFRVFRAAFTFSAGPLFALLAAAHLDRVGDLKSFLTFFLILGLMWGVLGILGKILPPVAWIFTFAGTDAEIASFLDKDRFRAFFKHPNQLGIALSAIIPIVFSSALFLWRSDKRRALLSWIAALALGGVLILCGSKANLLVSATTTIFILFVYSLCAGRLRAAMLRAIVVMLVLLALAPLAVGLLETMNPRAHLIISQFLSGDSHRIRSLSDRDMLWEESINLGLQHPIIGVGSGSHVLGNPHSHNVFLDVFRGSGVGGLLSVTVMIFSVLALALKAVLTALRIGRADPFRSVTLVGGSMSVIAYIVANQSSDSFGPSTSFFFWLSIGLIWAGFASRSYTPPRKKRWIRFGRAQRPVLSQ